MSLRKEFMIRKLRAKYALDIVDQRRVGTRGSFGPGAMTMEPVMNDVSTKTVHFSGIDELGAYLRSTPPRNNDQIYRLSGQDLSGIDLTGAQIAGIEFMKCKLDNADFTGAHLPRARIFDGSACNADFTGANLIAVALADMDMTGADIKDASIQSMVINRCHNLPDLNTARGGEEVRPHDCTPVRPRKRRSWIPGFRA